MDEKAAAGGRGSGYVSSHSGVARGVGKYRNKGMLLRGAGSGGGVEKEKD
jgi:hypothetical protein